MTYREAIVKRGTTGIEIPKSVTPASISAPATALSAPKTSVVPAQVNTPDVTPKAKIPFGVIPTTPPVSYESPAEVTTKNIYKDPAITKREYDEAADYNLKTFGDANKQTVNWEQYNNKLPVYQTQEPYYQPAQRGAGPLIGLTSPENAGLKQMVMDDSSFRRNNYSPEYVARTFPLSPEWVSNQKQHEFNHAASTLANTDEQSGLAKELWSDGAPYNPEAIDRNYFDKPTEREQGVRSLQQGMFQDLGSRAKTPEEFKERVNTYLDKRDYHKKLNIDQRRYLDYLRFNRVLDRPSTLEQDAKNAPGLSYNVTENPAFKIAFEKRALEWYNHLCN